MQVQSHPAFDQHEEISFFADPASGLKAIVARHRIWDSPSVGGCRMRDYDSDEAALADVLLLSRGMTYKSVMAGLHYGGAKAVIIGVPPAEKREALFRAMGRVVQRFRGGFRTGVDVGLTPEDVETMKTETRFVAGTGAMAPAEATAHGVQVAIKASLAHRLGSGCLRGRRIAIQGLGKVGRRLAELLLDNGALVVATDVDALSLERARQDLGLEVVAPDAIHAQEVEVFSPCALGAVVNDTTVGEIRAVVVAGSANNQLAEARHGKLLAGRGILYAPDYIANAGGLIAVAADLEDEAEDWIWQKLRGLGPNLTRVFEQAEALGLPTAEAADRLAKELITETGAAQRSAA